MLSIIMRMQPSRNDSVKSGKSSSNGSSSPDSYYYEKQKCLQSSEMKEFIPTPPSSPTSNKEIDKGSDRGTSPASSQISKRSIRVERSCLKRTSEIIVFALERFFYKLGLFIGTYPLRSIVIVLLGAFLCCIGLLRFRQEANQFKVWVPYSSRLIHDKEWVDANFPEKFRMEYMLVSADNILTPESINALLDLDMKIKSMNGSGHGWEEVCAKAASDCYSSNLLELWMFDETTIRALTAQDILDRVNTVTRSPVYYTEYNIEHVLAHITRDPDNGNQIVSAGGTLMFWMLRDQSEPAGTDLISLTMKDEIAEAWEDEFISLGGQAYEHLNDVLTYAHKSFQDMNSKAITKDIDLLLGGYGLVIVYVTLVLGKFNMVQHRIFLSCTGVGCIALSMAACYGVASALGFWYGPVHSILPFLILGIGVDDMFIIVQCLENLSQDERRGRPLPERVALALQHAGVSITVTSFTDFVAFGIGATTILPAMRSFCIFAAIALVTLFILQCSLFIACLTLDQRRADSHYDACLCCIKHKNYEPWACSQVNRLQQISEKIYIPLLKNKIFKSVVVMVTLTLAGMNAWSCFQLELDFDPIQYIPTDSYVYKYFITLRDFYPTRGYPAELYIGEVDYFHSQHVLNSTYHSMMQNEFITSDSLDSWYHEFVHWLGQSGGECAKENDLVGVEGNGAWFPIPFLMSATHQLFADNINTQTDADTTDISVQPNADVEMILDNEEDFYHCLFRFITRENPKYMNDVKFNENKTHPRITASRFKFQHSVFGDSTQDYKNAALEAMWALADSVGLPANKVFPYSEIYRNWQGGEVIGRELFRNLGLAMVAVFSVTLVLISNIWASCLVWVCVIFTLVDVAGTLQFWGLSIETALSINLILAVGLAVDYAAHMAHTFMVVGGTNEERMSQMVRHMAPAVFNGGFSTFLAFVILAGSKSLAFGIFFKVYFTVVLFGLFHGLIFLPVILSWLGPPPYESVSDKMKLEAAAAAAALAAAAAADMESGGSCSKLPPQQAECEAAAAGCDCGGGSSYKQQQEIATLHKPYPQGEGGSSSSVTTTAAAAHPPQHPYPTQPQVRVVSEGDVSMSSRSNSPPPPSTHLPHNNGCSGQNNEDVSHV